MPKTNLTLEIEEALKNKFKKDYTRYAFEVPVPNGIVDALTAKIQYRNHNIPWFTCYEIKVSLSDYWNSENGANFIGDENYYIMPAELIDEIIAKGKQSKFEKAGLIQYKEGKFKKLTDGVYANNLKHCELTLNDRFNLLDKMLMRVLTTGR